MENANIYAWCDNTPPDYMGRVPITLIWATGNNPNDWQGQCGLQNPSKKAYTLCDDKENAFAKLRNEQEGNKQC